MKGFSLKRWIEQYQNYDLDMDAIFRDENAYAYKPTESDEKLRYNDVMDYQDIALVSTHSLGVSDVARLKQKYIECHREKGLNYDGALYEKGDDYMEFAEPQDSWRTPSEDNIIGLIGICLAGHKSAIPDWRRKSDAANRYINTMVSEGYDVYALMAGMKKYQNMREKDLSEENAKPFTAKGPATAGNIVVEGGPDIEQVKYLKKEIAEHHFGVKLLENAEKLSPYKEVFDISDKIAMMKKQISLNQTPGVESDPNFDYADAQEQIEELQKQLQVVVADFDADFLKATGDSRLEYLTVSGDKEKTTYHYVGLGEIKRAIKANEKQQRQHMEDDDIREL